MAEVRRWENSSKQKLINRSYAENGSGMKESMEEEKSSYLPREKKRVVRAFAGRSLTEERK